jgi:hypothetical protein
MITPQIEEKTKLITEEIEKSDLGVEEKTQFIELINTSKATCNGMSTEEKIQGLAENNFQTNCILARITMLLKEKRATTWKDVAIRALNSWHLVVMVGFLTALFAFRPEIAEVLKAFAH